MAEAKDTIITDKQINEVENNWLNIAWNNENEFPRMIAKAQAEITWDIAFKAGQEFTENAIKNQLLNIIEAIRHADVASTFDITSFAERIHSIYKEAGYVKLMNDQRPDSFKIINPTNYTGTGWRKVEESDK